VLLFRAGVVLKELARSACLNKPKPEWVGKEVLRLKTLMSDAGCRTISTVLDRLYAKRG